MLYFGIQVQFAKHYQIVACASEEAARVLQQLLEDRLTVRIIFDTAPIMTRIEEFKPSWLRYYELDCGCDITDWDGRITVDRCWQDDCCDPELCMAHPNFFTQEYTITRGVKEYV